MPEEGMPRRRNAKKRRTRGGFERDEARAFRQRRREGGNMKEKEDGGRLPTGQRARGGARRLVGIHSEDSNALELFEQRLVAGGDEGDRLVARAVRRREHVAEGHILEPLVLPYVVVADAPGRGSGGGRGGEMVRGDQGGSGVGVRGGGVRGESGW